MKNLTYICLLTLSVLLLSCEDVLDEENRNAPTAELLYNTEAGFESLVNACYAHTRVWYGKTEGWAFSEMGTDCWTYTGGSQAVPFGSYSSDFQGSLEVVPFIWNALYRGLNTCNTAIANLPNAPLDEATLEIREGEIRFLRAFFLWHIVETWGEAPMQLEVVNSVVTTAHHTSVDDFYTQIFSDLDLAIQKLATVTGKGSGRVTLNAAKAFKARMLLTRGRYEEASELAKEVIDSGLYSMYDSFAETFDINNTEGTTNNEAIWWVNYSEDYALSQRFDGEQGLWLWQGGNHGHMLAAQVYWDFPGVWVTPDVNRPYVNSMPTLAFLNMFDETIDERYDVTFRSAYYVNNEDYIPEGSSLELGDTAAYCTKYAVDQSVKDSKLYQIVDKSDVYDENGAPTSSRDHFISLYKFEDNLRPTGWECESSRDAYVLRIPEMYLIVAEAALMEGNLSEAVTYINAVREKRAIAGKEEEMKITESDVDLDFILDERAREFAGEQLRWFDLKRTGKLIERNQKYNPDAALNIKDFHRVRPFPQSELDAITNKDEFTQNEGYN